MKKTKLNSALDLSYGISTIIIFFTALILILGYYGPMDNDVVMNHYYFDILIGGVIALAITAIIDWIANFSNLDF